jgi:hypothetical protein
VLAAPPAAADPAGPTNDRSRILSVEPEPDGAQLRVVGGDAFLRLTLEPGVEASVPGYRGEPYLRFLADGRVEVNRRSPATYLNEDRGSGGVVPAEASADGPPRWEQVADGGDYAWHDHRIHWMGGGRLDARRAWEVELAVDGRPVVVRGELVPLDRPLPIWPFAVAAAAAAAVLWAGRGRRRPVVGAALAAFGAAALATALAWGDRAAEPPGAGAPLLVVAVPAAAAGAALVALALRRLGREDAAAVLVLASIAATAGWVVLHVSALWYAIIPSELPSTAVRAGLGLVCGLVVAGAVLALRGASGTLAGRRPPVRAPAG